MPQPNSTYTLRRMESAAFDSPTVISNHNGNVAAFWSTTEAAFFLEAANEKLSRVTQPAPEPITKDEYLRIMSGLSIEKAVEIDGAIIRAAERERVRHEAELTSLRERHHDLIIYDGEHVAAGLALMEKNKVLEAELATAREDGFREGVKAAMKEYGEVAGWLANAAECEFEQAVERCELLLGAPQTKGGHE